MDTPVRNAGQARMHDPCLSAGLPKSILQEQALLELDSQGGAEMMLSTSAFAAGRSTVIARARTIERDDVLMVWPN